MAGLVIAEAGTRVRLHKLRGPVAAVTDSAVAHQCRPEGHGIVYVVVKQPVRGDLILAEAAECAVIEECADIAAHHIAVELSVPDDDAVLSAAGEVTVNGKDRVLALREIAHILLRAVLELIMLKGGLEAVEFADIDIADMDIAVAEAVAADRDIYIVATVMVVIDFHGIVNGEQLWPLCAPAGGVVLRAGGGCGSRRCGSGF